MSIRTRCSLGLLLVFAGILSGCNKSDSGEQSGAQSDDLLSTQVASEPTDAQPQGPAHVSSAETELGTVLVGGDGLTLYIYAKDLRNTPSCYGDCMQSWPPLLTDGSPVAGESIDPSKLGTTTRHDGTFQVAYSGRPLYLFRGDTAPGDTLGHGIEDLWQVLLPSGELLNEGNEGTLGDASSAEDEDYNPDDNY